MSAYNCNGIVKTKKEIADLKRQLRAERLAMVTVSTVKAVRSRRRRLDVLPIWLLSV